jgi:hypothetical protein
MGLWVERVRSHHGEDLNWYSRVEFIDKQFRRVVDDGDTERYSENNFLMINDMVIDKMSLTDVGQSGINRSEIQRRKVLLRESREMIYILTICLSIILCDAIFFKFSFTFDLIERCFFLIIFIMEIITFSTPRLKRVDLRFLLRDPSEYLPAHSPLEKVIGLRFIYEIVLTPYFVFFLLIFVHGFYHYYRQSLRTRIRY